MLDAFIEYLLAQEGQPYVLGGQHTKLTPSTYESVIDELEAGKGGNPDISKAYCKKKFDEGAEVLWGYDCSGLGLYWLYDLMGFFEKDMQARHMMERCTLYTTMPKRGWWVFRVTNGRATHIGYMISDTELIEAKRANGVRIAAFASDGWSCWGIPNLFAGEIKSPSVTCHLKSAVAVSSYSYRGKSLGDTVTKMQWVAIMGGTFEDLHIGDYWTINGVNWRIAAFDYYYQTGDTPCKAHHVTLVPDTFLYTAQMNDTNTTDGAYVGSKMYTEGLEEAKTIINAAFGVDHVLNHRQFLKNAAADGVETAGSWYDSTVELMTEQNLYGCKVYGGSSATGYVDYAHYTVDKSRYPLFAFRPDLMQTTSRKNTWLRDVATSTSFCQCGAYGTAYRSNASNTNGVRPAFSIC